jgi:hypothetical protein
MKAGSALAGIVLILISVCQCDRQTTTPDLLSIRVAFVPASADTAVTECGIDAVPQADAIQLQWQLQSGLSEYRLYRKAAHEARFALLVVLNEPESYYTDSENILLNTRYFYYLIAANREGRVTQPSDTVDYMLLPKPINLAQAWKADTLLFHWQPAPQSLPDYYLLKLFDDATLRLIWLALVPSYQAVEEKVIYNRDGQARLTRLETGRAYRWRVDAVGSESRSGSESQWQKFTMP